MFRHFGTPHNCTLGSDELSYEYPVLTRGQSASLGCGMILGSNGLTVGEMYFSSYDGHCGNADFFLVEAGT